jgi:hypothetical protein
MLDTRITAVVILLMVHVFSTQTVAEFYPRRSKPNLDKSATDQNAPSNASPRLTSRNTWLPIIVGDAAQYLASEAFSQDTKENG